MRSLINDPDLWVNSVVLRGRWVCVEFSARQRWSARKWENWSLTKIQRDRDCKLLWITIKCLFLYTDAQKSVSISAVFNRSKLPARERQKGKYDRAVGKEWNISFVISLRNTTAAACYYNIQHKTPPFTSIGAAVCIMFKHWTRWRQNSNNNNQSRGNYWK